MVGVRLLQPCLHRAGDPDTYPQLTPALTRPIRWDLIAQQYDQMIKYATAIRTRIAPTEAILRRFTRNASNPACPAMLEVGHVRKANFVARCLRLRDLKREIEEGLNVMESANGANGVIAYGNGGEIASNRSGRTSSPPPTGVACPRCSGPTAGPTVTRMNLSNLAVGPAAG
ncbi:Tn3 family transposase [Streptomyces sp. NPDC048277]|uniref:Tn3 family transposase n=1 Tax=Streptomyces sp. NPDC048277 TaxID=3155027 RepID=UPI0033EBBB01